MPIEIRAVGGYREVGKNMTAIKVDDEVIIIDMGIHLPNYINYTQDQEILKLSARKLIQAGAIPDDSMIYDLKDKVKAIVSTHGHLDHIAAIPYLAGKYKCPVIATPFTCAVLRRMLKDEKIVLPNKIIPMERDKTRKIGKNFELIFVGMTHSIPQTVTIALRTKYGILTYSNDFKMDKKPVIGKKPNYRLLKKLGDEGVHVSIVNCLYAWNNAKTPSESVVREMLMYVLLNTKTK
ncbi:MAG: ribonuclease J, partial [Candidatus Nanoarchaeia archaeon]